MKFSEFVGLLHPVVGGGSSTPVFTKSLFEAIVTEDGQSLLDGISSNTYKAYFNGHTEITKLAQKISAYIEPEEFTRYIGQFSDAATQSLCDSFLPYLPDISAHNANEKISELFATLIKDAASAKRKKSSAEAEGTETIEAEVVDDYESQGTAEKQGKKITVIQNQTNVVQNGENNYNLTNNGTINIKF